MRQLARAAFVATLLTATLIGCTSKPIYSVNKAPIHTTARNVSMSDIEKAIIRAGAQLGWKMTPVRPGLMQARLDLRSHTAAVDITYDLKSYSIHYRNSSNLDYNDEKKTIHRNYNGWVQNLDKAIQSQLQTI